MKKIVLMFATLALFITSANAVSYSWIESKIKSKNIDSIWVEVDAAGFDFRQYTWPDPAGRICTVVFTDKKGGNPDCDFPPAGFDYSIFK